MSRPGPHWNPWTRKPTTVKGLVDGLEGAARAASKDPERFGVTREQIDATANVAWAIKKGDRKRVEMLVKRFGDKIIGGVNEVVQWLDGMILEDTMRGVIERLESRALSKEGEQLAESLGRWRPVRLEKLGGKADARSWETLMREAVKDVGDQLSPMFLVLDVQFVPKDGTKPNEFKASGSMVRLANYFAEHSPRMKEIRYRLVTVTSDRNVARKGAMEV